MHSDKTDQLMHRQTVILSYSHQTKEITQNLNSIDSDFIIRMDIETKKNVELEVIRQDLVDIDGYMTGISTVPLTSVRIESNISTKQATDAIRDSKYAELLYCYVMKAD